MILFADVYVLCVCIVNHGHGYTTVSVRVTSVGPIELFNHLLSFKQFKWEQTNDKCSVESILVDIVYNTYTDTIHKRTLSFQIGTVY